MSKMLFQANGKVIIYKVKIPVPIKLYTCFQAFQVQSGFMPYRLS